MGCDAGQLRVAATEGDVMPQCIRWEIMFHRSFMTSMKCGVMLNDLVAPIHECWQSIIDSVVGFPHQQFNIPFLAEVRCVFE